MTNIHYTPEQISRFTIPQFLCLHTKHAPSEKKLENAADFMKVLEEETRRETEWNSK